MVLTMSVPIKEIQAPDGAAENILIMILSPLPGLYSVLTLNPRFHRGLLSFAPPALNLKFFCSVRTSLRQ
jgi:hypothetical protein